MCRGHWFFLFMMDEEDLYMMYQNRQQHRFWTRTWCQSRDDEEQTNTIYKLQQELLQVSITRFTATLALFSMEKKHDDN